MKRRAGKSIDLFAKKTTKRKLCLSKLNAVPNQAIIPAATAVKFPTIEASYSDGKTIKLPFGSDGIALQGINLRPHYFV